MYHFGGFIRFYPAKNRKQGYSLYVAHAVVASIAISSLSFRGLSGLFPIHGP